MGTVTFTLKAWDLSVISFLLLSFSWFLSSTFISSMLLLYWHLTNTHTPIHSSLPQDWMQKLVCHLDLYGPELQISNLKWLSSPSPTPLVLYVFKYWPSYRPSTRIRRLVIFESYFMIVSFSKSLPRGQVLSLKIPSFEEIVNWIFTIPAWTSPQAHQI